jgi:SRSO17 transposase
MTQTSSIDLCQSHVIAAGVRFGCVLADAGYGLSAPFRQGLTGRKLAWAVGIPRHLKVYPVDVRMIFPVAGRGRPRRRHVPDILSVPAEDMLADAPWRSISWRTGTKGKLKARFAAVRVRVADGPPQRIRDKGQQHLPFVAAFYDPTDPETALANVQARPSNPAPCQPWSDPSKGRPPMNHQKTDLGIPAAQKICQSSVRPCVIAVQQLFLLSRA